ncbi:MAG: type II toxin-antitoxin system VapC family toxin [Chloroflexota bacterium]
MTSAPRHAIVCDASVAIAWLLEEAAPTWVEGLREPVAERRLDVMVPTLFWLEVGNRLMREPEVADEQVLEGVLRLEALGIETVEMDRPLRVMAVQLARRHRLSIYDAVYLALAETSDLPLATLDGRLADAAMAMGRRYGHAPSTGGGHRAHEAPVAYGTHRPADPMSLAALGAYLAELRAELALKP